MILEACVGNLQDAIAAQRNGAHQIELCSNLHLDGNSPSTEMVQSVTEALDIPVKIIVNPKPFDYYYSKKEIENIKKYIERISTYNVAGIVFGPVDKQGMPDVQAIDEIRGITPLPISYHKAIDQSPDIYAALLTLIANGEIGFILTSGGKSKAEDAIEVLTMMNSIVRSKKTELKLIAAGKITNNNLPALHDKIGFSHYHGKLIVG